MFSISVNIFPSIVIDISDMNYDFVGFSIFSNAKPEVSHDIHK